MTTSGMRWLPRCLWCSALLLSVASLGGCRTDNKQKESGALGAPHQRASRVAAVPSEGLANAEELGPLPPEASVRPLGSAVDAGLIPPSPLREDRAEPADVIATREASGVVLQAEWHLSRHSPVGLSAESSPEGMELARRGTALRTHIELSLGGRMHMVFEGHGFPWPDATELRGRIDRYGTMLLWPDGSRYRHVVTGATRALFEDRRLDVGSLFVPKVAPLGNGVVAGLPTVRQRWTTPVGDVDLDMSTITQAGSAGILLCRLLSELVAVDPVSAPCDTELVPLRAEYALPVGGSLSFVVTQVSRRTDLDPENLLVPPARAAHATADLPLPAGGAIPRPLLSGLRSRPGPAASTQNTSGVDSGLVVVNGNVGLRAVVIDGIIVAWVAPGAEITLGELKRGTYSLVSRDFFGIQVDPPRSVTAPGRVQLGSPPEVGPG